MTIKEIDIQELRKMRGQEGLILQGCGGELTEWVEGINNQLMNIEILLEGSRFENCYTFQNGESTCLLFPFEDQKMNVGKFNIWRLVMQPQMGSMWLSDFVDIYLDGFIKPEQSVKPACPLIGADGNIFNLSMSYNEAYRTYLQTYCNAYQPKFLSYDNYPFEGKMDAIQGTQTKSDYGYFKNLAIVREVAEEYQIPFWTHVQAGAGRFRRFEDDCIH